MRLDRRYASNWRWDQGKPLIRRVDHRWNGGNDRRGEGRIFEWNLEIFAEKLGEVSEGFEDIAKLVYVSLMLFGVGEGVA